MDEPKRWLETSSGALPEESEILLVGVAERMPSGLRGQVWSAITLTATGGVAAGMLGASGTAAQTGVATAQTTSAASAASKGIFLSLSSVIKGVIVVAVLGGVGAGAVHVRRSQGERVASQHSQTRSAPALVPAAAAALTSRDATSDAEPSGRADSLGLADASSSAVGSAARPEASMAAHAPPALPTDKPTSAPLSSRAGADAAPGRAKGASAGPEASSRLREESAAVLAIRRALLAGNAREALALLARARADFPHGALVEEREALSVRALLGSGQPDAARLRGEAFLRRFPRSPQASDVRRWLGMN